MRKVALVTGATSEPLTMLVNNAGVAHYMPLAELPADQARELACLVAIFQADLAAFGAQSPEGASRYRS